MENSAAPLPDVVTGAGRGLLALAVDLDFVETQAVFVLYTTDRGLRLARFRVVGDMLTARAIILEGLPVADVQPNAILRMGPDRKLYIALDDRGEPHRASDLGDLSGKVLRLNVDGTTPDDQPLGSPVYLAGVHRPTGLAWASRSRSLWVADSTADGLSQLQQATTSVSAQRAARARFELPVTVVATALVADEAAPVRDGLLVASDPVQHRLLRVVMGDAGEMMATAWSPISGEHDTIRAMTIGPGGVVYACTSRTLIRFDATNR